MSKHYNQPFDPSKPVVVATPAPSNGGPNTAAGKSISSRNAMRHGCCASETLIMPHESIEDFQALEAIWLKAYAPVDEAERHLLAELVESDWFLQRATRAYADVEAGLYGQTPNPVDWTEAQERKLGRFLRYRTAHTNNVHKCRKALDDYRKARAAENQTTQKAVMQQERHDLYKEKNKPQPTISEIIQNMLKEKREKDQLEAQE